MRTFLRLPWRLVLLCIVVTNAIPQALAAASLEDELGRSEVRVRSAPMPLIPGRTVADYALEDRLKRLGYLRVRKRPTEVGTYFWGHEVFWIYRRAHRVSGDDHPAALVGLTLRRRDGMITGATAADDGAAPDRVWIEGETLAESVVEDRARRLTIRLDDLPEHVWQPVLAAEDGRFFDHGGVDAKGIARALLANIKAGGAAQGGSTITQQLIKNRDLTAKKTLGRKMSEAVRALWLEAHYDKREILEAYLNHVYLGHVDGRAIHGVGAAARAYFSRGVEDLSLAQTALLAGMIQAPNRYAPQRHPERAKARRDWVLSRLEDLEWIDAAMISRARETSVHARLETPPKTRAAHFLDYLEDQVARALPTRTEEGRGMVVETTLDAVMQTHAETTVREALTRLRRRHGGGVQAALVALDAASGDVLAYVGGHPDSGRGGFDRARTAKRQPGSAIKPFVLLEAFGPCGNREPLYPASQVADRPLTIDLPSGPWQPANDDGRFVGTLDLRRALADSRNVPFVRVARWCGFDETAERLRAAGLAIPTPAPPAFALGAVETSPLALAAAYTTFPNRGGRAHPRPFRRIERPGGRGLANRRADTSRVTGMATAYLVHDLLRGAAREGTAQGAAIDGVTVFAKTGTSSERRDAWLAGYANGIVTVVWVGRDEGKPLGLAGSQAAAPIWKRFMIDAVRLRPPVAEPEEPGEILHRSFDPDSGMLVRSGRRGSVDEIFRRRALPPRKRFFKGGRAVPVIQ